MDIATILTWFKRGCKPTEAQFAATFKSFRHKDDKIPIDDVDGLTYELSFKSENGHTHTLSEIIDYDGGDKEVLNAMVAQNADQLDVLTKTVGLYYIELESQTLYQCEHDEGTDSDILVETNPDGKVIYSALDVDEHLHIYLYNVPNMEFQDVTNEQVDKTIYTNDLASLVTQQLEKGIYAVVHVNSDLQGNAFGDAYTLTVGDSNASVPSRVLESRSGWAQSVLDNGSYVWQWHRYSYDNHNHDSAYAAKTHSHSEYLTSHQDISGKQDVISDLATIRANAQMAATRAYTLDFGTAAELIQDVNMLGAITINEIRALNVAHLYVTYGNVTHQEIDLTQPVSLNVANHAIITWEIVRTTDDGLACVGVRCSINQSNA